MSKFYRSSIIFFSIFIFSLFCLLGFYLKALPLLLSNAKILSFIQKTVEKSSNLALIIKNPELKTELSPLVSFSIAEFSLLQKNEKILEIKNFSSAFSFEKLLKKRIIIKKIGADYIFADLDKLSTLGKPKEKTDSQTIWTVDIFNALLYIKNCVILYNPSSDVKLKLMGKNIAISETRNPKFVHFNLNLLLQKNNKNFLFRLNDNKSVFIKDKKLYAKDCEFFINKSKVYINYVADENKEFELKVHSNKFHMKDIIALLESNLIIPNGSELLSMFNDINGSFNFNFKLNNDELIGVINLNELAFKSSLLNNLPVFLTKGNVYLNSSQINLKNFVGYYGKSSLNKITFSGVIKDYMKSFDTEIIAYVVGTKEFTNDYLSKIIGYPIELVGKTTAKIKVNMINNIIDSAIIFRLIKGDDILIDGVSLTPVSFERAFRADFQLVNNILTLKNLNYYISKSFQTNVIAEPLLKVYGNFDMAKNMEIQNIGFEIPKPLPSEFLNVLIGQRVFRKGTISGNLEYIQNDSAPSLLGNLSMKQVRIPAQRLSINEGILQTNDKLVKLNISGKYKRSDYKFSGKIANEMKLPVVVKDIQLSVDDVDIERIMRSFSNKPTSSNNQTFAQSIATTEENEQISDDEVTINTDFIIIEKCILEIVKGRYKQINFSNVLANMSLDEKGILQIHSNKFNIAEGTSSAKVWCDLKKQLYKITLGIKDVDSDAIATSLLNLPREISGKARGIIFLETDKNLKLNGSMKFDIKDGVIAKIGLVEYALKFVVLFRNPLAMISPATIVDLVNVPEGDFDKINGSLKLKDNVIENMIIKSSSPQLSSFTIGRYNLENGDASLRIYTKLSNKNKGLAGFLRNISLNSLANKVPLGSRNDSLYYAAELSQIPSIDAEEKDCQVFLTKIDGDVVKNNFLSSLKRIK